MHAGTLSLHAQKVLAQLGNSGVITKMYLAGGTALALQLGHRVSHDFDFYVKGNVLAENIARDLGRAGAFTEELLEPCAYYKRVALASVKDIAAMKLTAICGRATKRDYADVYVLAKRYGLDDMLVWYDRKYGVLGNNVYTIIKALGYFDDAESDDMPKMLTPVTWEHVKAFLLSESMRLAKAML